MQVCLSEAISSCVESCVEYNETVYLAVLELTNYIKIGSSRPIRHHSRHGSWGQRLMQALSDRGTSISESKGSIFPDERVWYDQFTSTDWVHDTIADSHRVKALNSRKDFWGRVRVAFDASQGWILSALCGFIIALIAYAVDVSESTVFDWKDGYCTRAWYLDEKVRVTETTVFMLSSLAEQVM